MLKLFMVTVTFAAMTCTPTLATLAKTYGELTQEMPANLATASATSGWSNCGGSTPAQMELVTLLNTIVCYGKTNPLMAEDILSALDNPRWVNGQHEFLFEQMEFSPQIKLAEMKLAVATGKRSFAALYGEFAVNSQKRWDDGILPEEQTVYYNMLSSAMKTVLLAHGGTMNDNRDARPQEWKTNGPGVDLWIYKSGGAMVTTYIFKLGKLTTTLKP